MDATLQISGGGRNCMVCEIFPSWLQGSEATLDFPNLNSYSMSCGKRSSLRRGAFYVLNPAIRVWSGLISS
jgi:hypothetical protein